MQTQQIPVEVQGDNDQEIILQKPPEETGKTLFKYSPD
jgi:hypothetical protein